MSTTLIPPSFYLVKPRGRPARAYSSAAAAADAIVLLGPIPAVIGVVTGRRSRSLIDGELRELGRRVRARRTAVEAIHRPRSHDLSQRASRPVGRQLWPVSRS